MSEIGEDLEESVDGRLIPLVSAYELDGLQGAGSHLGEVGDDFESEGVGAEGLQSVGKVCDVDGAPLLRRLPQFGLIQVQFQVCQIRWKYRERHGEGESSESFDVDAGIASSLELFDWNVRQLLFRLYCIRDSPCGREVAFCSKVALELRRNQANGGDALREGVHPESHPLLRVVVLVEYQAMEVVAFDVWVLLRQPSSNT